MSENQQAWDIGSIGEYCITSSGGTPNRSDPLAYGGDIPWVKSGEVASTDIWGTQEHITLHGLNSSSAKIAEKGSVLVAMYGATAGQVARLKISAATNQAVLAIRPKSGSLDSDFLYHFIHRSKDALLTTCQGSGQPNLSAGIIRDLEIAIPPLPEQKKIASVLTCLDRAIETSQKLINKVQDLKKATTNELLTKGIDHKEFKESELGGIPNDWESVALGEFCREIVVGHVGSTSEHYIEKDGVRFIRTGDLKDGRIRPTETKQITREFHHKLKKSSLKSGDVLVSRVGDTGQAALVPEDFGEANCANIIIIRCGERLLPQFLRIFINSEFFFDQVARVSIGSAQAVLNIAIIKRLLLSLPRIEEQRKICLIVHEFENSISNLKQKLTQTKTLKVSLMQDLLSGRKRVSI